MLGSTGFASFVHEQASGANSRDPATASHYAWATSSDSLIDALWASTESEPICPCVKHNSVCARFAEWFSNSGDNIFPYFEYQKLLTRESSHHASVDLDIPRTFPRHPFFAREENRTKLRRILYAYAVYDEEVGYVQGMNFVCGFMLYHSSSEINTFSLLVNLMKTKGLGSPTHLSLRRLFLPGHVGLKMWCFVVQQLLYEECPKLFAHLLFLSTECEQTFPQDMFLVLFADIFLTLFTSSAPFLPVTRIWDLFFAHGWIFICRLCVSFLNAEREMIMQAETLDTIMMLVKSNSLFKGNLAHRGNPTDSRPSGRRLSNRKWFALITDALARHVLARDQNITEAVKSMPHAERPPLKVCGEDVREDYF